MVGGAQERGHDVPVPQLGKLQPVEAKSVWAHEAHDFTPWLLENADALADVLGIDLELTINEHPVGGFSLDLLGKDLTHNCVLVVENQLVGTDHSHLGQLLTYAAGTEAATVVWVAAGFREEHRQALDWLNDLAGYRARFFGLEVRAVRIGDSAVAPLFTLRVQPNDWHAQVAASAKATSQGTGKGALYRDFWTRFLERVKQQQPGWTRARVPAADNWMTMPSPLKGCVYGVNFTSAGTVRTELYIDAGDAAVNARVLEALHQHRQDIETAVGEPLSWEPLPQRRACRIAVHSPGDVTRSEEFDSYIDWFLDVGARFRAALEPHAAAVRKAVEAPAAGDGAVPAAGSD